MAEELIWAGDMGKNWASRNAAMDRQLAPVADLGLKVLAPQPGERVLDLGCGGGATTAMLAEAVAPDGHVTGLDISPDLLTIARDRMAGRAGVEFIEADAQEHGFGGPPFDALFSRFGCMFFSDPAKAYANLRAALRPGARALFLVYTPPADNYWASIPARVANEVLGPAEPTPPDAPGPFGWQRPDYFAPILSGAGFRDVTWAAKDLEFEVGEGDDPDPVARATSLLTKIGPVARRLRAAPEGSRERLVPLLSEALRPYVKGDWVVLPARIWVITARV